MTSCSSLVCGGKCRASGRVSCLSRTGFPEGQPCVASWTIVLLGKWKPKLRISDLTSSERFPTFSDVKATRVILFAACCRFSTYPALK